MTGVTKSLCFGVHTYLVSERTSGVMYDHTFSNLTNNQISHQATHKVGRQPGDCIWPFNLPQGLIVVKEVLFTGERVRDIYGKSHFSALWLDEHRGHYDTMMDQWWKSSGWISDSYCSLKLLWSGMGEVVPARTSPTLHPPSPPTVL